MALARSLVALVLVLLALVLLAAGAGGAVAGPLADVHEVTAATTGMQAIRIPASAGATWCGTATDADRTPNVVAGHPVHWLYATPSDQPDRFSTYAHAMQTDAEAIDAWWRREDAARAPRNDLTRLTCGTQLDLTSLRLQRFGSDLVGDVGFAAIFNALNGAGFGSPFTKYVVYYDGPLALAQQNVCGRGAGDDSGFGLAVVYVRACAGVPTATVAVHELLHTLGAVPAGAPNGCSGHVCGDPNDLMAPSAGSEPLETKVLDAGRDDYYGHLAPFTDVQDAPWLVQLDRQVQLKVSVTGPGRVVSDVPGLDCTRSCTTTWNADTRVRLTAEPSQAAKLVRWNGACRVAAPCGVTAAAGATVSALFAPRVFKLSVGVAGQGNIRTSRKGVACRPSCSASLPSYVPVRLTATPAKGWKLRRWVGACAGQKRSCTLPMSQRTSARAVFVRVPKRAR